MANHVRTIDQRLVSGERSIGYSRHLLGLIGGVAALRIPPDPLERSMRREAEHRVRTAEREEWARLADVGTIPDEFAEEFDRQSRRIEELELANEILEEERSRLENDVARLARSFADVQATVEADQRGDAADTTPATLAAALRLVADAFPESLVVLSEAYESAEESRYPRISRAQAALMAIGEVAQGWHDGTLASSFDEAFGSRGFDLRSISQVTQGRFAQEWTRTYEGHRVLLGPHLALGSGGSTDTILRIYWYLDESSKRFVLGHVGRHLRDAST
jgi:hypothetical protein